MSAKKPPQDTAASADSDDNADSFTGGLSLHYKLRIVKDEAFYGPGAHELLELTGTTGSLREACRQMGISYGKGRYMVSRIEKQLGRAIVRRRQGGKSGGSSVLTGDARKLMRTFEAFQAEASESLQGIFDKHFNPAYSILIDGIEWLAEFGNNNPDFLYTPLFEYIAGWLVLNNDEKAAALPVLRKVLIDAQDCDHTGTPWEKDWIKNGKVCRCPACNTARKCISYIENMATIL
ncbi:MAG: hypothetical protein FWH17_08745 [Oscillospiraceae bacterium]|nr:hypothetical protein [Oscillospiraceae bacterium]